jgi:hypothetical protein
MAEDVSFENAKFLKSFKKKYLNILIRRNFGFFDFVIYFLLIHCLIKLKAKI